MAEIKPGKYRHFKGGEYEMLFIAKNSETLEDEVVYRALYGNGDVWVRPTSMWSETVIHDGKETARFTYIDETDRTVTTLETARLILRTVTEEDAAAIYDYSKIPEVGLNAGWKPHESLEESLEITKAIFAYKPGVFVIIPKDTGRLIGTIGVIGDPKRDNESAGMLGYAMDTGYGGKGIMTEAARAVISYAFDKLGLAIVTAYCYPYNTGSRRVLEKCGFEYEGTLALCEKRFDGAILDNECYSLGAAEFREFMKSETEKND